MRHVRNPQMELGEIGIENIRINLKSRDDIPALLWVSNISIPMRKPAAGCSRFSRSHASRRRPHGRPPGHGALADPGDGRGDAGIRLFRPPPRTHNTLRRFWERISGTRGSEYQTVVDNVCLVRPELLAEVGQQAAMRSREKSLASGCEGAVIPLWWRAHYPTDVNLLWDATLSRGILLTSCFCIGQTVL